MKSDTHTVKQLFKQDVRYMVPLYQRPYVWNRAEQWEPLWKDVTDLLQHQESGTESWSHFLGAVVLDHEKTVPGQIPRYTVIDGQQRLTTLQLLIAAAARAAAEAGAEKDAKLLRGLVANDPLEAEGIDRFKVWPTNANRAAFAAVMAEDGPPQGHTDDPGNLIDEAFDYFTDRAAEYLKGEGVEHPDEEEIATRAERLRITLCELLKVVAITLEQDDNAQVIFETLNARGTPLLSLDLVKNAVFHRAGNEGRDTDRLYERVWKPQLDDDHWREEQRQGRLNRPRGELFLMHWLTMRLERVVPATELFATFRQGILDRTGDAEALIRELCADAEVIRSFENMSPDTPEGEFFARFEALNAGTFQPLVLLLFRSPEVTVERRRRALRILESWLARRALMRLTTQNYNRLVASLLGKMKADLPRADEVLRDALAGPEGASGHWPRDAEFVDHLCSREAYNNVAKYRLTMALAAVEASLHSNKTEQLLGGESYSLEHLLPQNWEQHWPLTDSTGAPLEGEALARASEERSARLHRLGNLTIVAQSLNSALSNAPWTKKRSELNRHSVLLLNSRLAERDTWDEQAIDEHGEWLARRLTEIWPGPESSNWA
ncbi:uncharacterized protein DUF1524 [Halopolyspora algeriensis]|uniref:Uncharacterized protein DUF1524 n=1 Tax=Halopolyspora algeriensis TaxID=1500506 RepID=A0A368VUW0_9ACTN|nr:DUF262 domain-containing protein [Halopolyspora algeriensis]RCW45884.1 uncharacterized protein DUF1524 [Halopolyspora algeriensis]TQM55298.1 uncharacterized protein DUF1524 [Halopolyspora algeriensis]